MVQRAVLAALLPVHLKHGPENWPMRCVQRKDRLDAEAPQGSFTSSCSDEHTQPNLARVGGWLREGAHGPQRIHGCAPFAAKP